MRMGKLTNEELNKLVLSNLKSKRPEVLVGAGLGEDCASFAVDGNILISSDPITGTTKNMGSLAIKINSNDIVSAGGTPILCTITLIVPPDFDLSEISDIMKDADDEAMRQNIQIVGGHTEISDSVNKPIISCTIIGKAEKHKKSTNIKNGDCLLITKHIGMEGTAILINENKTKITYKDDVEKKYLNDGISIRAEGEILRSLPYVNAMHDITEGGIFGAVCEICHATELGADIFLKDIPMLETTEKICKEQNIDPYRLISSGSLLISTNDAEMVISSLKNKGILATIVGKVNNSGNVIAFGEAFDRANKTDFVNLELNSALQKNNTDKNDTEHKVGSSFVVFQKRDELFNTNGGSNV